MSEHEYQVGEYWLARDKEGGPYKINWYDQANRKVRRRTTGQRCLQQAIKVITEFHLSQMEPEKEEGLTARQVSLIFWQEHASGLTSSEKSRVSLDRLNKFLVDHESGGDHLLAEDWTKSTTSDFVKWMRENPYTFEAVIERDEKGKATKYETRARNVTDSTVNRNLAVVRAAFRFCMDRPPTIKLLQGVEAREGRAKPTLSIKQVKDLFAYAYAKPERRHLQNYLIVAISTMARPDAIIDVSVAPERNQIEWDYRLLRLNPDGRKQNKKYRPNIPINDYLLPIVQDSVERLEAAKKGIGPASSGFLVEYNGKPVSGMRPTWNRAKEALGWPCGGDIGRDWDIKMLRHTMAKRLRAAGVPWPELQGQLGHSMPGITEAYAEYAPDYLGHAQAEITRYLAEIFKGQKWTCTPLAPHLENTVTSINSKK